MKKIALFALVMFLIASCGGPKAKITATFEGLADTTVVLQKLNFNKLQAVDTLSVDGKGKMSCKVELSGNAPYFYYLYVGEKPVASLALLDGDKVNVKVAANGNVTIDGSEESAMLQKVNDDFASTIAKMEAELAATPVDASAAEVKAMNQALSRLYVDYKRSAIKQVISNPYSISSAVVLFQKYNDNLKVFGDVNDAVIFSRTLDSLSTVYPQSDYVLALRDEVSRRENQLRMANKLSEAGQASFPELQMPDVNGKIRKLSDFEGKVVVLSFWSVGQGDYKMFNNELISLYKKYHSQGLEIYQVGLDVDKPSWAAVVKAQPMDFVNVNDGYGIQSQSVAAYNINHIPAMYVFDRKGNVVGVDEFDNNKLESIIKRSL